MGSFDAFSDEVDIRVPEVRVWSPGELLRLLNMNETDANSLKENWERKQTYRKFGL
jgi:hypothetical protein